MKKKVNLDAVLPDFFARGRKFLPLSSDSVVRYAFNYPTFVWILIKSFVDPPKGYKLARVWRVGQEFPAPPRQVAAKGKGMRADSALMAEWRSYDGTQVIRRMVLIEVQNYGQKDFVHRLECYLAAALLQQLEAGERDYSVVIPACVIAFAWQSLSFSFVKELEDFIQVFSLRGEKYPDLMTPLSPLLYLIGLYRFDKSINELVTLVDFVSFIIIHAQDLELKDCQILREKVKDLEWREEVEELLSMLWLLSEDKRVIEIVEAEERSEQDQIEREQEAGVKGEARGKAEGRAEGRAEGKAEGAAETMKNVTKRLLNQGWSYAHISDAIGLDYAEIAEIAASLDGSVS